MALVNRVILTALLLCATAANAADGNEIFAYGAIQKSLGGAGAAHAFDSSWVLLNPAATTELEGRLDLHIEVLRMETRLHSRGIAPASNPFAGEMDYRTHFFIPTFTTATPRWGGVVAWGVLGAQGNRVDYPEPFTGLGLLGNTSRRSEYAAVKFPISYARAWDNGWSVGAALVPTLARYRTDTVTPALLATRGGNVWDYEVGGGFVLGVHKVAERLRVGAAYHSPVWMGSYERYSKDLLVNGFGQPQKIQAGVALQVRPHWEVLVDYKWIDWDSMPQFGNEGVRYGLGWRDQHIVKAGVQWTISPTWQLRAGASHGKSPVPDSSVFVNSLTPGISETTLALGGTWQFRAAHAFHWSVSHVLPHVQTENGRGDFFSRFGRGTQIGFSETAVALEYSLTF